MVQSKSFRFPWGNFTIHATAYLYGDGMLKDVEIEAIWFEKKDLLAIWKRWTTRKSKLVDEYMVQLIGSLKKRGAEMIHHVLYDGAAPYYEIDFLS